MKNFRIVLFSTLAVAVLALPACRKERPVDPVPPVTGPDTTANDTTHTSTLRLRLVPEWEGQAFLPFVELQNVSGYRVQVEKVQFYLGDIRLASNGTSISVSDIELVNFNDGPVEFHFPMAASSWDQLSMGLGVPYDLNHLDPALYANDHPLSVSNAMHWTWTQGYIFLKFEGRYDTLPSSSGPFPNTYSIHTGFDTAYAAMDFHPLLPWIFEAEDTTTITLKVAIDKFFHSDAAGTIDLATENASHGMNVPLSLKLTTNAVHSFSLQ